MHRHREVVARLLCRLIRMRFPTDVSLVVDDDDTKQSNNEWTTIMLFCDHTDRSHAIIHMHIYVKSFEIQVWVTDHDKLDLMNRMPISFGSTFPFADPNVAANLRAFFERHVRVRQLSYGL